MLNQTTGRRSHPVGNQLLEALTQTEIADLLDALLISLPPEHHLKMLAHLPADTRQTVQSILAPAASPAAIKTAPASPVSTAKLEQTWASLWGEWDRIVTEAAQEDGDYITQEHHWEEPYFDQTAFVEDLEQVAQKMRPLIPNAVQHLFSSPYENFAETLLAAEEEVSAALPEWIYLEGFSLGENLTFCLLEWEWLHFKEEEQDAFAFAQQILDYEAEFSHIGLDYSTCLAFLRELPEPERETIFAGLTQQQNTPPWADKLKNTHSYWHTFYMDCIAEYAPERYMDSLRATIPQQWLNGLAVIEELLAKKDYPESRAVIRETLSAMLKAEQVREVWSPETTLLFPLVRHYSSDTARLSDHQRLLDYYQQTATGLGKTELVNVLSLQRMAFEHFFDWTTMFKAFAEVAVSPSIRQALFASWRAYIIQRAKPQTWSFGWPQPKDAPWWLHWLIDSLVDPQKGPAWFQQQMSRWLTQLPGEQRTLGEGYDFLRLLTKDLTETNGGKNQYPQFYQMVIRSNELTSPDQASRQAYLRQSAQPDLLDQVMTYWQTHLHNFVPRPEDAQKSDYTAHAHWMAALRELAPDNYATLLNKWQIEHHRRRNLWQAMAKLNLR